MNLEEGRRDAWTTSEEPATVCVWMCEHLLFPCAFQLGVSGVFQENPGIHKPKKTLWSNAELTEAGASSNCSDSPQIPGPFFIRPLFSLVFQHPDLQMHLRERRKCNTAKRTQRGDGRQLFSWAALVFLAPVFGLTQG